MNTVRLSAVSMSLVLAVGAATMFSAPDAEARGRGRVFGAIAAGVVLGAIISESARAAPPPKRAYREDPPPRKKTTRATTTRPATVRTSTETRGRTPSASDTAATSSSSAPRTELPGGEGTSASISPPPVATAPAPVRRDERTSAPVISESGGNSKVPR